MNFDLGKVIDLLKATRWQSGCLALACFSVFYLDTRSDLPIKIEKPWPLYLFLAGVFFLALFAASVGPGASQWLRTSMRDRSNRINRLRTIEEYIPHMTDEEKLIIGWLLSKNQKSFTYSIDGGRAVTLISRGIIDRFTRPGQAFAENACPFVVPDDECSEEARGQFSKTEIIQ